MYLQFVAIFLLVNKIQGQSYQSSVIANGKPILRSGLDVPGPPDQPAAKNVEPLWVAELRTRIEKLVSQNGYDEAKPLIKEIVDDTQRKQSVLLDVKVDRDGESEVAYEYEPKVALRTNGDDFQPSSLLRQRSEPEWVGGVKAFVKNLVNRYGRQKLDAHLRPVIENLEKEHSVRIRDIDVDTFGEILVDYQRTAPRTRPPRGSGAARQGKKQQVRQVTQIDDDYK